MDSIEKICRERAAKFYANNPKVKNSILFNHQTEEKYICQCGNYKFKLYKSFGGLVFKHGTRKIIKNEPKTFNFVCSCGVRLVLKDGDFYYGKVKFGCAAVKCPYGLTKMNKDCLRCKYIIEK